MVKAEVRIIDDDRPGEKKPYLITPKKIYCRPANEDCLPITDYIFEFVYCTLKSPDVLGGEEYEEGRPE